MTITKQWALDAAERAARAFAVVFIGQLIASGALSLPGITQTALWAKAAVAGLGAAASIVLSALGGNVGDPSSASLLPKRGKHRREKLEDHVRAYLDTDYLTDDGDRRIDQELTLPQKRGYGWVPQKPDPRDLLAQVPATYSGAFVDLSAQFPDSPYDQGQLGSCTGNGVAAAVDFARAKQGLTPLRPPSRLFIYYCERDLEGTIGQDSGAEIRDGFKAINKWGVPAETDYPYDVEKFTDKPSAKAYSDAALDEAVKYLAVDKSRIFDVVASGYPVVFGFNVPKAFEGQAIATHGSMAPSAWAGPYIGGHCTVVVSTPKVVNGVSCVKVRNSWGTEWGDGGYFWMPVSFLTGEQCSDFWMVATMSDPTPTPAPPPFPDPTPAPVVDADDQHLWAAVSTWVNGGHGSTTRAVAAALKVWASDKGLS